MGFCSPALLDLGERERRLLLRAADPTDPVAYESFLTAEMGSWPEETAVRAVDLWEAHTSGTRRGRLVALANADSASPRLVQRLLEAAPSIGPAVVRAALRRDPAERPEALRCLLFQRTVEWGIRDPGLSHLAEQGAARVVEAGFAGSRELPFALDYLARFDPRALADLLAGPLGLREWRDAVALRLRGADLADAAVRSLKKLSRPSKARKGADGALASQLFASWPPVWARTGLDAGVLAGVMQELGAGPLPQVLPLPPCPPVDWRLFAGISTDVLVSATSGLSEDAFTRIFPCVLPLLGDTLPPSVEARIATLRLALPPGLAARVRAWSAAGSPEPAVAPTDAARRAYFDREWRSLPSPPPAGGPWEVLAVSKEPTAVARAGLALPAVFRPCVLRALERFPGRTELDPFLNDLAATTETAEFAGLVRTLATHGTPASLALLVRLVGRAQTPHAVRLEILHALATRDLGRHRASLRELARDLTRDPTTVTSSDLELREALADLLGAAETPAASTPSAAPLESDLEALLPGFGQLPLEVRRALRTARHLLTTLGADPGLDVSPAVEMQYKALEILFRARFEDAVFRGVAGGVPTRRLERLGYGRDAAASAAFDEYLCGLPVVRDIPGLGRTKLGRILRAVAHFRPGQRFTLDGLKAFGLTFLAFGRKECEHGLARALAVDFGGDHRLFELCRNLHLLQDIRNRAVHEGLPAGAMRDAQALWSLTGELLKVAMAARVTFEKPSG